MFAEVTYLVLIRRHRHTVKSGCRLGEIYIKKPVTCGWPFESDLCPMLIVNPLENCKRFCCDVNCTKQNRITPTASVFDFVLYVVREVASGNLTLMPHGKCFGIDLRPLKIQGHLGLIRGHCFGFDPRPLKIQAHLVLIQGHCFGFDPRPLSFGFDPRPLVNVLGLIRGHCFGFDPRPLF